MAVCLAGSAPCSVAADETVRLRVSWGGGAERLWHGSIAASEGSILEATPLGIEADEPGSMWLEEGRLIVRERSPRAYDGVELLVCAPLQAKLLVGLSPTDDRQPQEKGWIESSLADRLREFFVTPLDDRGNRLLVTRSPDDALRVKLDRDCLVFGPGETFRFELQPHLLPVQPGTRLRIRIELCPARSSDVLWSTEHTLVAGEPAPMRAEVGLPRAEGVFDVVITALDDSRLRLAAMNRRPLAWRDLLAVRKVQLVVIGAERPLPAGQNQTLNPVEEIDPANPRWWERFARMQQFPHLKRFWKGPLGSGSTLTCRHLLGEVAQLGPSGSSGVNWEAYTLPIRRPGTPHVLEIEYPSDVPQTLGISIVEPNATGAVLPWGIDSGVDVPDGVIGPTQVRWLRHRIVFWPRTRAPLVVISNRRGNAPAVFGKIRVFDGWDGLPHAFPVGGGRPERLLAAYLDRPLFAENFSASESVGLLSDLGIDDWVTFYQGGTRLVQYLNYVGYGGLMMSVLCEGSTIYPSRILEPSSRYDTGVFLDAGQDPVRKDGLEMLFRLFDREGLALVPALDFSATIPELEDMLRHGGPAAEGIAWVGPQGATWTQVHGTQRGRGVYYNVLHPRVQQAMLSVIGELVRRYGRHPSFAGLGLQLTAQGYAQLPDACWGVDDATIARFEQARGVKLLADGPRRFDERAIALTGRFSREWLAWRAEQLNLFHQRIEAELTRVRPDARLFLAGADMFSGEELEEALKPALPRRMTLGDAMLRVGIDAPRYRQGTNTVLLRPERIAPRWSLASLAISLEIERMPDADRAFQGLATPGSLFFHAPQEVRLASFDAKSPYQPCQAWLATEAVPSAVQNRRRFVHALATLDAQVMFDGSWQLPLGQEDALRPVLAVYRQLPAARFERLSDQPDAAASQPVTFRSATCGDSTYAYVVNDAPFAVAARVRVTAPRGCRLDELTGLRQVPALAADAEGASWSVDLEPYDVVGIRFSMPGVKLSQPQVKWPAGVREALEARVADLGNRAATLRNAPVLQVLGNPGFERPKTPDGRIAGWTSTSHEGVNIDLDTSERRGGVQSLHMTSRGPTASLISQPFDAPHTGRLTMLVWLRVADPERQPILQLALQGKLNDHSFYRVTHVGQSPDGQTPVKPLTPTWNRVLVPVDDLPLEGLSQLQVRFDLVGPGEVWIDDVQLCSLDFGDELVELFKLLWPAEGYLQNGQVTDCMNLLEGYWPRFLTAYVPPVVNSVSERPVASSPPSPSPPKQAEESVGFFGRMKRLLPDRWR